MFWQCLHCFTQHKYFGHPMIGVLSLYVQVLWASYDWCLITICTSTLYIKWLVSYHYMYKYFGHFMICVLYVEVLFVHPMIAVLSLHSASTLYILGLLCYQLFKVDCLCERWRLLELSDNCLYRLYFIPVPMLSKLSVCVGSRRIEMVADLLSLFVR